MFDEYMYECTSYKSLVKFKCFSVIYVDKIIRFMLDHVSNVTASHNLYGSSAYLKFYRGNWFTRSDAILLGFTRNNNNANPGVQVYYTNSELKVMRVNKTIVYNIETAVR
jgi:hypothetical protein